MIPLKDNLRPRSYPFVNVSLILLNILLFVYQLGLGRDEMEAFLMLYGVIPQRFLAFTGHPFSAELWKPLITSIFLHGGWLHLLGNMLYLWVFGANVEDRWGHGKYLLFYLLCGAIGGLFHIFANPHSPVPTIGASGAVAGILGAYFIFFPLARVLTLVPIGFFLATFNIPAMLFLFLWFLLQFVNATMLAGAEMVAWWAHIGGFIFGAASAILLLLWRKILDW